MPSFPTDAAYKQWLTANGASVEPGTPGDDVEIVVVSLPNGMARRSGFSRHLASADRDAAQWAAVKRAIEEF